MPKLVCIFVTGFSGSRLMLVMYFGKLIFINLNVGAGFLYYLVVLYFICSSCCCTKQQNIANILS